MASRILLFTACALFASARGPASASLRRSVPVSPKRVLVVENTRSADSVAISAYYRRRRGIPLANLCRLTCSTAEECPMQEFRDHIEAPLRKFLADSRLNIDFIVLTKGIPIRTTEGQAGGFCTDSLLTMLDWSLISTRTANPYFLKDEPFSHKRFHMYLVTRLDGYTREDCLRLIDRSLAARPANGLFLLDVCPSKDGGAYRFTNDGMRAAADTLRKRGLSVELETTDRFAGGVKNLMGYFSWGSNDARYDAAAYHSLGFLPGGIAETAVSTSARTFADPKAPGQSLIADLIAQGVTGCKGYVSEPYVDSIAKADILFDRYTAGYTLAESFYMASAYVYWKDIVIGDPLCAPYATAPPLTSRSAVNRAAGGPPGSRPDRRRR